MSQILGVKFNDYGQVYYFGSGPFVVREGQHVIVKTDQGMGLGKVILIKQAPQETEDGEIDGIKAIYRLANEKDMESVAENDALAKDSFKFCRKCVTKHKLGMKLVDVEVFFDRSKMVFYFTAPGRIDFRELIKDLVREYHTRIELRQIGVRHETQMLGAIGNCGQICCCRRFMRKFVPVTIKMAKEQNLFLNPTKISGICGRLLCCLSFEQKGYEEFHRMCPRVGKKYTTTLGAVKVLRTNFFKKSLSLMTESFDEKEVSIDEWNEIVNKPPSEEAMAEIRAQSAKARRGGRRPMLMESPDVSDKAFDDLVDIGGLDSLERQDEALMRADRKEKPARPARPPRTDKPVRPARPARSEQPADDGRPAPDARPVQKDRPERGDGADKADRSEIPGKSVPAPKPAPEARSKKNESDDDSADDAKGVRRPRRRRRRPPRK